MLLVRNLRGLLMVFLDYRPQVDFNGFVKTVIQVCQAEAPKKIPANMRKSGNLKPERTQSSLKL